MTSTGVSGTISVGSLIVSEDSLELGQLIDVSAASPSHNELLVYNDSALNSEYADGWVTRKVQLENLGNVNAAATPNQRDFGMERQLTGPSLPDWLGQ